MLWIRIGFTADPTPAFYLNADPDPDTKEQTNADPDPGQTSKSQKLNFYMKNILKVGTVKGKKHTYNCTKNLFERQETRFISKF